MFTGGKRREATAIAESHDKDAKKMTKQKKKKTKERR
jgi:hypothetical protein